MAQEGAKKGVALPKGKLDVTFDRVLTFLAVISAVIAAFQLFVVDASVFARFVLNKPITWVEDVASLLIIWVCFLVSAYVLMTEGFNTMDFFYQMMKGRTKATVAIFNSVLGLVCAALTFWYGLVLTIQNYVGGFYKMGFLRIPNWPVLIAIPIGSFFFMIQWIRRIRDWVGRFQLATVEVRKSVVEAKMEDEEKIG